MFTQKRFWSLVVLLMLCLVLAACTAAPTPGTVSPASDAPAEPLAEEELATSSPWINKCEGEPVDGGTVTLAFADQAMRGENWLSRSSTNQGFVFSQLVDLNIETLEIEPDVAESWEISEDGLTYTYHLRDDVLWHDGEQLMADDVKWTIEMFWHPDTNIPTRTTLPLFAIAGVDEFADGTTDEITGIQVLDDFTKLCRKLRE